MIFEEGKMLKMHPLLRGMLSHVGDPHMYSLSWGDWIKAGAPLVEEEPRKPSTIWDDEGTGQLGEPLLDIKSGGWIPEAARNGWTLCDSFRERAERAERTLAAKDARIKELERENYDLQLERGLVGALEAKAKELEAKLAEAEKWHTSWNAALEEAAKEFDCIYKDNAPSELGSWIAARIRALKKP